MPAEFFEIRKSIVSDAPRDVEITCFAAADTKDVNVVLMNEEFEARHVDSFKIKVCCEKRPRKIRILPSEETVEFSYQDGMAEFTVKDLDIFRMYRID